MFVLYDVSLSLTVVFDVWEKSIFPLMLCLQLTGSQPFQRHGQMVKAVYRCTCQHNKSCIHLRGCLMVYSIKMAWNPIKTPGFYNKLALERKSFVLFGRTKSHVLSYISNITTYYISISCYTISYKGWYFFLSLVYFSLSVSSPYCVIPLF